MNEHVLNDWVNTQKRHCAKGGLQLHYQATAEISQENKFSHLPNQKKTFFTRPLNVICIRKGKKNTKLGLDGNVWHFNCVVQFITSYNHHFTAQLHWHCHSPLESQQTCWRVITLKSTGELIIAAFHLVDVVLLCALLPQLTGRLNGTEPPLMLLNPSVLFRV